MAIVIFSLVLLFGPKVAAKMLGKPGAEIVAQNEIPQIPTVDPGDPKPAVEVRKPVSKKSLPADSPADLKPYSKIEVIELIKNYAAEYGIPADLPLRIALCESGYRWDAKNKSSTASGVFQYLSSTWQNTQEGRLGISVFDARANISAAVRAISVSTDPWNASKNCWS